MDSCPYVVGEPVQSVQNPNIMGKIVSIISMMTFSRGTYFDTPIIHIETIGKEKKRVAFWSDEIRVCSCATRIPKGVSKWQK